MKTLISLILINLSLSSFANPGETYNTSTGVDGLSVFLKVGVRPFQLESSDISFRYTDESPSMDNMVADVQLKEALYSTSFKVGAQYELPQGIFFKVLLDGYLGQAKGLSADFGVGYSVGKKKFHFRPQAIFSYGGSGLKLGDLYQNDVYIEVNGTQFYSNSVLVKVKSRHFVFSPEIEFAFNVGSNFEIMAGAGYNIAIMQSDPYLSFSGSDVNKESISESESIFAPNVFLTYEGDRLNKSLVDLDNPFFNLGLAYRFGK